MPTKNQPESQITPPMVHPGERAVLLSHHEYRQARSLGAGLESYDLLMRQPHDEDAPDESATDSDRWLPVRADKYLKHRATGWREAESIDELPEQWLELAQGRDLFPSTSTRSRGGK
jgi:hypothetical protein